MGIGAYVGDYVVKWEEKASKELEKTIEETKTSNRRRFGGEGNHFFSAFIYPSIHPFIHSSIQTLSEWISAYDYALRRHFGEGEEDFLLGFCLFPPQNLIGFAGLPRE